MLLLLLLLLHCLLTDKLTFKSITISYLPKSADKYKKISIIFVNTINLCKEFILKKQQQQQQQQQSQKCQCKYVLHFFFSKKKKQKKVNFKWKSFVFIKDTYAHTKI